jgi:hypothetical protein
MYRDILLLLLLLLTKFKILYLYVRGVQRAIREETVTLALSMLKSNNGGYFKSDLIGRFMGKGLSHSIVYDLIHILKGSGWAVEREVSRRKLLFLTIEGDQELRVRTELDDFYSGRR